MELAVILWAALVVVFLIIEAACPLHLVSVWFAVGALAALGICALKGALWLQITAFVIVSGGLLLALWPLTKKFLTPKLVSTNIDSVIGAEGLVITPIDNLKAVGQVKLGGMEWTARSTSGEAIPEGTRIRVDRIEGVKVFVSPAEVTITV